LRLVLAQATVAGLAIAELTLQHPERMLDPGPQAGDDPVDALVDGVQLAALRGLAHDTPDLALGSERRLALAADVALVAEHRTLVTVQQVVELLAVVHLGGAGFHRVDHAAVEVDADMRLHAEVPCVAFLRAG